VEVVQNDSDCELPRVYGRGVGGGIITRVTFFVDDGLIVARSKEACERACKRLVCMCKSGGQYRG
jgi:hypothetical protein